MISELALTQSLIIGDISQLQSEKQEKNHILRDTLVM